MVENKRKKHHDKDKYYRLAKEQGLRSRAAFKLSQINRKFHFLENAKIVLDLCAAPGGWTQIASRSMARSGSLILSVDVLPIRAVHPNVITLVGDITTDKCRSQIKSEMQGAAADVVLCDGAPNVGASYDKDAYTQNELALHALKCATEHLRRDGVFVTKLYRSRDYSAYLWVAKQFFKAVQAVKPAASRSQSAEIFLVCTGYLDPTSIDSRMLDPRCVFEQVDGAATGGGDVRDTATVGEKGGMNIFHKKFFDKRRQRQGYDMDVLDASMRNVGYVSDFVGKDSGKDPVTMLSVCTGLSFTCALCADRQKGESRPECRCKFYLEHPLTTSEIKACVADLKVLNRGDFKGLLNWRTKLQDAVDEVRKSESEAGDDGSEMGEAGSDDDHENEVDSEAEEEAVQKEIQDLRERKMRERKRQKKKERKSMAKGRRRADMGLDLNAFDVPDSDKIFSLATIASKGDLEAAREVDLSKFTDEQLFPKVDLDDEGVPLEDGGDDDVEVAGGIIRDETGKIVAQGTRYADGDEDEKTGYSYRLDRELDEAYDRYLRGTKDGSAKTGTKMAKRTKKALKQKAAMEAEEDEKLLESAAAVGGSVKGVLDTDAQRYAKMLGAKGDDDGGDDSSSSDEDGVDDDDDGFHADPATPEEHRARREAKKKASDRGAEEGGMTTLPEAAGGGVGNPLIYKLPDDPASVKTARWFSNPLFESIGSAAKSASMASFERSVRGIRSAGVDDYGSGDDSDADVESLGDGESDDGEGEDDEASAPPRKGGRKIEDRRGGGEEEANKRNGEGKKRRGGGEGGVGLSADEVLAMMPKTDKQKRHEKRIKALERKERQMKRRAKLSGETDGEFEVAPAEEGGDGRGREDEDDDLSGLDEARKKKILEARALIKAGIGLAAVPRGGNDDANAAGGKGGGFEVVPAPKADDPPLPVMDPRKYDSENEDYDSDDYAKTLALGTMMLRRSKAKALVDASYNRYAWNDPEDLPDWFVDDENRHYRPQLPIPPELVAKMKERAMALSTRPIAKVAEARARKNKRAKAKLAAAKKKAEAVANSSEMSEAMKLKAISKAMRGQDLKRPGKTYVVSKKGGKTKGGKGVKLVDKRMINDKRAMERAQKKRKKGKQGGLTGSKKRRHHK